MRKITAKILKYGLRKFMLGSVAGLTTAMLVGYAVAPVKVQAMPLVERIPGVGPLIIPVPEPVNSLPLDGAGTRELSVQETLLKACERRGYGTACAKALLGMMWKESLYDGKAIGDRGEARGYFQIWYRLHDVPVECAEDLACSAEWTLDYLEYNGYPRYAYHAVQCHNGCNAGNGYAASVLRHGERMWSYDFTTHPKTLASR